MDNYEMVELGMGWLWRASWQASVLAVLVLPVAPSSAWSVFNLAPRPRLVEDQEAAAAFVFTRPATQRPLATPADFTRLATVRSSTAASSSPRTAISSTRPAKPVLRRWAQELSTPGRLFQVLTWMWAAGALIFGGRMVFGSLYLSRQLRDRTVVGDGQILGTLDHCRQTIGVAQAPELLATSAVDSPALFGWFRCRLLVPAKMVKAFSLEEWRHVFLHELAHIRRRDVQVNWLMVALQNLHWFNPVVWFAFQRMRADRELACDAAALSHARENEAKAYGQTIIKLLEGLSRPAALPALVGILEDKKQIKQRIRMIACFKKSPRWPWLAGLLLAVLSLFTLTDAQTKPSPEAPQESNHSPGKGPESGAAEVIRWDAVGRGLQVGTNAMFLLSTETRALPQLATNGIPHAAKTNRIGSLRIESDEFELATKQAFFRGHVKATEFIGDIASGALSCARLTLKLSTNDSRIELLTAENEVQYEMAGPGSSNRPTPRLTCDRLQGEIDQGSFVRWIAEQNVQLRCRDSIAYGDRLVYRVAEEIAEMIGHPRAETPQDTMTSSVIRIDPKQDTLSIPAPWKRINHPGPKPLNSHRTDTRSDADGEEPIAELNPTADVPTDVGPKLGDEAAQTARTNRQRLQNKLERIVLDQYPTRPTDADLPLSAVLEELAELSRQRDPDKLGVNFLISSHLDRPTLAMQQLLANQGNLGGPGFAPPIDPTTGLPAAAQGTPAVILLRDLRTEVTVRIRPALHNVRLKEVLDSIEMVAEAKSSPDFPGIKYSVSEYAVVFSQRTPEIDQLYNKTFKVDPNSFIEGMEKLLADKSETASSTGKLDNAPAGAAPGDRSTWVLPFVNHDAELHRSQPPTMDLSMSRGLGGGSGSAPYTGLGSTSVMRQTEIRTIQDYVRQFFSTATGIDFGGDLPRAVVGGNAVQNGGGAQSVGDPGAGPGRQFKYIRPMFFNDRTGVLFVRATMEELDLVEQAIQVLQIPPGHVVVRVDAVLLALNTGGPDGSFDQHFPILVKRPEVTLTSNGMSVPSSIDRFVGALPERQFQALEEAASHGDGFERLAAPTITMVSGGKGWLQLAMSELLVEVTPETVPNGHQVQLAIDLTLAAKARTGSEPDNQPSTPLSIRALVGDGETVILGKLTSAELGITPKLGGKEIVYALCITPRMVDPASKPGKKQDDQPDDPGIVPVQKAVRPQDEK